MKTQEDTLLARLMNTLSTNVAIGGLALVVLGAGGTSASLAASHSDSPKPDTSSATETDDADENEAAETDEDANESGDSEDTGTRPTDTHGYCVSQAVKAAHEALAKAAAATPSGEGADKVTAGSVVSAAAHSCDSEEKQAKAAANAAKGAAKKAHGKAYGKSHGTGRPAAVTPGAKPTG